MKRKISKKLVFNKSTVTNLSRHTMDDVLGGTLQTMPPSLCPEFTCGEVECEMTRRFPQFELC